MEGEGGKAARIPEWWQSKHHAAEVGPPSRYPPAEDSCTTVRPPRKRANGIRPPPNGLRQNACRGENDGTHKAPGPPPTRTVYMPTDRHTRTPQSNVAGACKTGVDVPSVQFH